VWKNIRGRLLLILFVVVTVFNLTNMAVRENFYGPGPLAAPTVFDIPPGSDAVVAQTLSDGGAIASVPMFRVAAFLTRGGGPVRAGEFLVPAHASLADILELLRHGQEVQHQVTIPPGLTAVQIAALLNAAPEMSDATAAPPEGSVFPDTYNYTKGERRALVLRKAQHAMAALLRTAWAERDSAVHLASPAEAVILASIVQQETPLAAEMPHIAAVYENRLARGMRLQADPTVIYAASNGQRSDGAVISRADLLFQSPYNTYVADGLPPGPICSPGAAAIAAVLHPAASADLFFVATGHGGHVFAPDYATQERNEAAYREQGK
jgi:UPF0755 protein